MSFSVDPRRIEPVLNGDPVDTNMHTSSVLREGREMRNASALADIAEEKTRNGGRGGLGKETLGIRPSR